MSSLVKPSNLYGVKERVLNLDEVHGCGYAAISINAQYQVTPKTFNRLK